MDITVKELQAMIAAGNPPVMIDVRQPHEWEMQHLPGVRKISMASLPAFLPEMADLKDQEVIMICRSGARSGQATMFLQRQGFTKARNLYGGMIAWKKEIDPDFNVS